MAYGNRTRVARMRTPQPTTRRIDERQVKNTQGHYVYRLNSDEQLRRFLILGTTAPTYHAGTSNVDKNIKVVEDYVSQDGVRVVRTIEELDDKNILIRKNQAIFILAYALSQGNLETRREASRVASKVVRTGRDMSLFVEELNALGGFGRLKRETISRWYNQDLTRLGYQVSKYRNTGEGAFAHRDILRLAHVEPSTEEHQNLFRYLVGKEYNVELLPEQVRALNYLNDNASRLREREVADYVRRYNLTHEMVPSNFKNSPDVLEALADKMPYRALLWNLSTFARAGMLQPMSSFERNIISKLKDKNVLERSRIHPFTILVALRNYDRGAGFRSTWNVNPRITEALEDALDIAFDVIEPSRAKVGIIVDTSGSMGWGDVAGSNITPREASGVLATDLLRKFDATVIGVDTRLHQLGFNRRTSMRDVSRTLANFAGGGTRLSLGMEHFINNRINVDCIVIYTDNEVNSGHHFVQMLDKYQREVNRNAKLVVVGMTASPFTIGDGTRDDIMNISGFDTSAPTLIDAFIKGEL